MKEIDYLGELERLNSDKKQKKKHRNPMTDLEKKANHFDMLLIHDRLGKHAPFNAVHQFFVGFEYIDIGEYPMAEQYLEEAIFMDPALIEAYLGLARIYRDSDSLWHNYLGERVLRIAYILNHNHPTVREQLIEIFKNQGEDKLIELVQKHEPLPPVIEMTKEQLDRQQYGEEHTDLNKNYNDISYNQEATPPQKEQTVDTKDEDVNVERKKINKVEEPEREFKDYDDMMIDTENRDKYDPRSYDEDEDMDDE